MIVCVTFVREQLVAVGFVGMFLGHGDIQIYSRDKRWGTV